MIGGRIWRYGDDVNTDVIFAGKYTYTITDRKEMARHAMEDLDPSFAAGVKPGDVIVAGANFGCGSSREQAVICLKEAGIAAIVARSFARIYFRNAVNEGLPAIICPEAVDACLTGDTVEIDLTAGMVRAGGREFRFPAPPEAVRQILADGGLIPHLEKKLKRV